MNLGRWRRDPRSTLLVLGGLVSFVAIVFVVVVLGGGALIGHTSKPDVGLSVLATAIVALGFEPLQRRLERSASRLVRGGRPSPYDVLSRFSAAVSGTTFGEELPSRMAKVLAEGTGAQWAQVWIVVQDRPTLAATHPAGAGESAGEPAPWGGDREGRRSREVRRAGELLGVLRLQESDERVLTPVEERLFAELADQAGLVLHGVRLRAELAARVVELSARAEELRHSRERLVDTQDAERRRLERDIHDGAQQHLVALAVNLRLAHTLAVKAPERAGRVLTEQVEATDAAIETLVNLSRGIYPRTLTEQGVGPALRSAALLGPADVVVSDGLTRRYPAAMEAAIYFCCLEALQNSAKHSHADRLEVHLREDGGRLEASVSDNGRGFDPAVVSEGAGLDNMRDRIDSVGGGIELTSASGRGTRVTAWVPVARPVAPGSPL